MSWSKYSVYTLCLFFGCLVTNVAASQCVKIVYSNSSSNYFKNYCSRIRENPHSPLFEIITDENDTIRKNPFAYYIKRNGTNEFQQFDIMAMNEDCMETEPIAAEDKRDKVLCEFVDTKKESSKICFGFRDEVNNLMLVEYCAVVQQMVFNIKPQVPSRF